MTRQEYEVNVRPLMKEQRPFAVLVYADDEYEARDKAERLGFERNRIINVKQGRKYKVNE